MDLRLDAIDLFSICTAALSAVLLLGLSIYSGKVLKMGGLPPRRDSMAAGFLVRAPHFLGLTHEY